VATKPRFPFAKLYQLTGEAVEAGLRYGWRRAHKHTDSPSEEQILSALYDAVMLELCERFWFDGD
jgi:hypothetical protein